MVMPMSLIILKDECPRYCSFIVSPRKYRYILLWIGCDVNNKKLVVGGFCVAGN